MASSLIEKGYVDFFNQLKEKIRSTQISAALAVNKDVINLYWHIGKQIVQKQEQSKWGDGFITTLSADLQKSFPESHGYSKTNLKYMRIFAFSYPDGFGQQPVDQLPWGHITILIRIKNVNERHWYISQCIENGWGRIMLEKQIRSELYQRQAMPETKITNYLTRLPHPQSYLAHDIIKNPYNFDCLGLHDTALERDIEHASLQHITKFLLELGKGFAFIGHQVPIEISERTYFIDMLFYHTILHCFVVAEIKSSAFKPEHAGQLNFYLSAVDDKFRTTEDKPSIGILLCKTSDKVVAEYALRGIEKPIGIAEYQLTKAVPEKLKGSLPSIEEIEEELCRISLNDIVDDTEHNS